MKYLKFITIIFIISTSFYNTFSQENQEFAELEILFDKLYFANTDTEKSEVNNLIITTLKSYIEVEHDFINDFKGIKNITVIKSDDDFITIFTWAVKLQNKNFKYFGFIKYYNRNRGEYYVDELFDKQDITNENLQSKILNNNWYGAVYYKIITKKYKKKRHYLLLGWDANDDLTNKKLIDILYIDEDDEAPVFGKNIIEYNKNLISRMVFEYGERVATTLNYDENLEMVIWDHLSPSKQEFTGNYKYYGPDLTFDGLYYEKGIWKYVSDIELNKK